MSRTLSPASDVLHWTIGAACLALLTRTWLVMGLIVPVVIEGASMEPTLEHGHQVLVDRTAYLFRSPRSGEVIVFRSPQNANEFSVKRIAGLPRQRMELTRQMLQADGLPVVVPSRYSIRYEDRVASTKRTGLSTNETIQWEVGVDEYFVVGDNAEISDDSRNWWYKAGLEERLIIGKAIGVR